MAPDQVRGVPGNSRYVDNRNIIDFSSTENPFGTPTSFITALAGAIEYGAMSYAPDRSARILKDALSRTLNLPTQSFLVGSTVSGIIAAIAQTFEPCKVGISLPCPLENVLALSNTGHKIERIPPTVDFLTPLSDTASSLGASFNSAVLANPGFPTSRLLSKQVLESYLAQCDWVIVDESHIELTLGGTSFAPLVGQYRNLVVVQSFAEQYALLGAPISYCIAHPDIIAEIERFYDASSISFFAEVLARPSVQEYRKLEEVRRFLYGEIPWMQTMLSLLPGFEITPAEANYVMCSFNSTAVASSAVDSTESMVENLRDQGCIVRPLSGVSSLGSKDHFCIAIRARQENEQLLAAARAILS